MDSSNIENLKKSIASNYDIIRHRVDEAVMLSGRKPSEITIVGVTKVHPPEVMTAGILAGVFNVGENRVQEAAIKIPLVTEYLKSVRFDLSKIRWHLIGPLQSNKANKAARLFDVIEALDSMKAAERLSRTALDEGKQLEVFIEVNTTGEVQKAGVQPNKTNDFVKEVAELDGLIVSGLMTIGPLTDDQLRIRNSFQLLRDIRDDLLQIIPKRKFTGELSMGMSDDFPIAITTGATVVRIGTAIFGLRPGKLASEQVRKHSLTFLLANFLTCVLSH